MAIGGSAAAADPFKQLEGLLQDFAIDITKKIVDVTPKQRMCFASQLVGELRNVQASKIFHGDIKPHNALWEQERAVLADFDESKVIPEISALMQREFRMESEAYKDNMKVVVDAFQSGDDARIAAATTRHAAQFEQLKAWKIVGTVVSQVSAVKRVLHLGRQAKAESTPAIAIIDSERFAQLRSYLDTKFLPTKSTGYACREYTQAVSDYFWRCEPEHLERACFAFDQRAFGIMIYLFFTAAKLPLGKDDALLYYCKLEYDLKQYGMPVEAAKLIHKMAEPIRNFNTASREPFPVPCTDDELARLQSLLLDASKPDSAAAAR